MFVFPRDLSPLARTQKRHLRKITGRCQAMRHKLDKTVVYAHFFTLSANQIHPILFNSFFSIRYFQRSLNNNIIRTLVHYTDTYFIT
jgi:hypothetical protein